jgi:hypothetical protein
MHYSNKQLTDEKEHNYRTHSQAIIPLKPLGFEINMATYSTTCQD